MPCTSVAPGSGLQAAVDAAQDGAALCLEPGAHAGPVVVRRRVALWGSRSAVVTSSGEGTTIRIEADGARVLGLTVDGSGGRFDRLDAAVHVGADDVVVEGLRVQGAVFGLLVEKANRAVVRGNDVQGPDFGPLGLRGDGIRLWETRDSLIEANHVSGGRDLVVWYSPGNRVAGNLVERGRYGTHFMYSHGNVVEDNVYTGNVVGVFVMYSSDVTLRGNVLARGTGAAGMGLGVKESGNLVVEDNLIVRDTVGCYVDTSPLQRHHVNLFRGNAFRLCETAVLFHRSETRNVFEDNAFRDNQEQVRVDGGGDALGVTWSGNDFDTYVGYDLDADGTGDVPYTLASLTSDLRSRHPDLAFFHGSPTLWLVDAVSHAFPLFTPSKVLVDPRPRMARANAPDPTEVASAR